MILVKIWLNDSFTAGEVNFEGYSVYKMDRNAAATGNEWDGGVVVAVKNSLKSRRPKINVGYVVE